MGFGYGAPDIGGLLAQKYAIMRQEADAKTMATKSDVNLQNIQAGLLPGRTAAEIALTKANTGYVGEQAKYFGQSALSAIDLNRSQIGVNTANIGNINANTDLTKTQDTGIQRLWKTPAELMKGLGLGGLSNPLTPPRMAQMGYSFPSMWDDR